MTEERGTSVLGNDDESRPRHPEPVELHVARVWLDEDGIVHALLRSPDDYSVEHAKEHIATYGKLGAGAALPVLVDIRGMTKLPPREVRQYYASARGTRHTAAAAVLVESDLSRVMANFFFRFHNPSHPIKLFTDEDEALAWLRHYSP
jgi:hypothetical protein